MSGPPQQPRQPQNLQGLLRFAMEATKAEDAPHDSPFEPLDEERLKFLENALRSMTIDVVETLSTNIQILEKADSLGDDDDITAYLNAFESILEHVYMIDTAVDFHKIGGFVIFPPCMKCVWPQIRKAACDLLAELCQNNPYCQDVVNSSDLLEQIINLLRNDPDYQVQIKAMYALGSCVRESDKNAESFVRLDGIPVIVDALQRRNDKLRRKVTFLMTWLIGYSREMRDLLIQERLIPVLIRLIGGDKFPSHEHLFSVLWLLVKDNPQGLGICAKEEYGFQLMLRNYLKQGLENPDNFNEKVEVELLLQAVESVVADSFEAER